MAAGSSGASARAVRTQRRRGCCRAPAPLAQSRAFRARVRCRGPSTAPCKAGSRRRSRAAGTGRLAALGTSPGRRSAAVRRLPLAGSGPAPPSGGRPVLPRGGGGRRAQPPSGLSSAPPNPGLHPRWQPAPRCRSRLDEPSLRVWRFSEMATAAHPRLAFSSVGPPPRGTPRPPAGGAGEGCRPTRVASGTSASENQPSRGPGARPRRPGRPLGTFAQAPHRDPRGLRPLAVNVCSPVFRATLPCHPSRAKRWRCQVVDTSVLVL